VRKIEIYQAGSSQHKLQLCVTNVMVHGPGVKLLDGLAEAKHQWRCDLHLPLPAPFLTTIQDYYAGPPPSSFKKWSASEVADGVVAHTPSFGLRSKHYV
jgi:hypothetical protein